MKEKELKRYVLLGLLSVFFIFLNISAVTGATYYVDSVNGSDTDSGLTEALAWKTIGKVNSFMSDFNPGDKILFKKGQVFRGNLLIRFSAGTKSAPIIYSSYGSGNLPIIMGSIDMGSSSKWESYGTNLYSTVKNSVNVNPYIVYYGTTTSTITYGIKKSSTADLKSNGDFFYDSANKRIVVFNNQGNPGIVSKGVEVPQFEQYGYLVFIDSLDYVYIDNLEFRYSREGGLKNYQGNYVQFTNLKLNYIFDKAINTEFSDHVQIKNNQLNENGLNGMLYNNGGENLWLASSTNLQVEGNTINNGHAVPINCFKSDAVTIKNNKVNTCSFYPGSYHAGIYFDACTNSVASYNTVSKCAMGYSVGAEISGSSSKNIVFSHNVANRNKISLMLGCTQNVVSMTNVTVNNNLFYRDQNVGGFVNDIFFKCTNTLNFRDNIILSDIKSADAILIWENSKTSNVKSDYNLWYNYQGPTKFNLDTGFFSDFPLYVTATGQDKHSKKTDPLLSDKTSFKPSSSSPVCSMSSTGSYIGPNACDSAPPPSPYCGDDTCNNGETCSSCSGDCGSCPAPTNPADEKHWLEAEFPTKRVDPMYIGTDGTAAEGKYAYAPNGADGNGSVSFTFNIKNSGRFYIWGRIQAPTSDDDSFIVKIDSGKDNIWDLLPATSWQWQEVSDRDGANPVVANLSAGSHTLTVKQREDGAKLDKILITSNSTFTPSGTGSKAENALYCGDDACNNGETCNSCSSDCGACPDTTIKSCTLTARTWREDTVLANAFDLGACFDDPMNEQLRYTYSQNSNVRVTIDSNGIVQLSPPANWVGTDYVTFTATAGSRSASTNKVKLSVTSVPDCGDSVCEGTETCDSCSLDCGECPVTPPPTTGSGGGKGGGGGGSSSSTSSSATQNSTETDIAQETISETEQNDINVYSSDNDNIEIQPFNSSKEDNIDAAGIITAPMKPVKINISILPLLIIFLIGASVYSYNRFGIGQAILSRISTNGDKKIISDWKNYFSEYENKGLSLAQIKNSLIFEHGYDKNFVELLMDVYREERIGHIEKHVKNEWHSYFATCLSKGFSIDQIRQYLINERGYDKPIIESLIEEFQKIGTNSAG